MRFHSYPLSLLCSPPAPCNWLPISVHFLKLPLAYVPSFPLPIATLYFQPWLPHAWACATASQQLFLPPSSSWSLIACWILVHSVLWHWNNLHKQTAITFPSWLAKWNPNSSGTQDPFSVTLSPAYFSCLTSSSFLMLIHLPFAIPPVFLVFQSEEGGRWGTEGTTFKKLLILRVVQMPP